MSAAADLATTQWQAFNVLLDALLDRPPAERGTFIDTLPAEHEALKPALRALVVRAERLATREFLATLPAMPEAASADVELAAGDRVGPYQLLRELGIGGMGAVWLAERVDGALKRQVALKLPRTGWTRGLAERMARERDILATLEHPNIARLYDAGSDAHGRPYLALEYVEGEPIDAYCSARQLPVRARVELLLQVARAVAFAHGRLVVHRDLKPSNILVTADGQVRLLDFGIAKLIEGDRTQETQLTQLAGRALTPDYASPEQIRGEPIGTASDVYSLGVVAFELLTGARPYKLKRGSAAELEEAVLAADVPLASSLAADPAARRALRGDMDAIVAQSLRKDVARRYASVEALAGDLARWQRQEAVTARPDSASYRILTFVRRNRKTVSLGALVVAILLGSLLIALRQSWIAREQSAIAAREARTAKEVQGFLENIFLANSGDQADPATARRRTAPELLDEGAKRIDEALDGSPHAKHEVLNTLAQVFQDMALLDRAAQMRARAVTVSAELFGRGSTQHILNLTSHARLLNAAGNRVASRAVLLETNRLLDERSDVSDSTRIAVDMALADLANFDSDSRGLPHAERAMNLLRKSTPSADWVDALSLLGGLRRTVGDHDGARQALAEAEKTARSLGGLQSKMPALYELWGLVELEAGRAAEGIELLRRVTELDDSTTGPDSANAFIGRLRLVNALAGEGQAGDALLIAQDLTSRLQAQPFRDRLALPVANAEAASLLALGRYRDVVDRLRSLRARIESAGGERPTVAAGTALLLAQAQTELGDTADAARLILQARRLVMEHGLNESLQTRCDDAEARLQIAQGNIAAARVLMAAIERAAPLADRSPLHATELRAAVHLAAHEPRQALGTLADGLRQLLADGPMRRQGKQMVATLRRHLGEALLLDRQAGEAIAAFQSSLDVMRTVQGAEAHPDTSLTRVGLATAYWHAGYAARARTELSAARAELKRNPHAGQRHHQTLARASSMVR